MQLLHSVGITHGRRVLPDATAVVDVVDFSDAEDGYTSILQHIEQHRTGRIYRIVVPARCSRVCAARPIERSRNYAAHAVRTVEQFPRDFAHPVELGDGNDVFVRGDLKHAVTRCIDNWKAGAHMLIAELFDDFGTRGRLVPKRLAANLPLKFRDDLARKTVRINGKRAVEPYASHLPMSRRGVFSRRVCRGLAESSSGPRGRREMRERFDVRKPKPNQIRKSERPRFGDMPERVAAGVAIIGRIGQRTDADTVQHSPNHPLKRAHGGFRCGFSSRTVAHPYNSRGFDLSRDENYDSVPNLASCWKHLRAKKRMQKQRRGA